MQGWWLLALGAVAFLYGAVGHAGASDYIAVLALAGLPAEQIKPLALILNTVVAAQGRWQFVRAGHLRWRLFWPVLLVGLPMAFLGGWLDLPTLWFQRLVALVLLAGLMLARQPSGALLPSLPSQLGWMVLLVLLAALKLLGFGG
ncbi:MULTISPECIES: TSUP family transporter [Cyanobium]|uniref:TSUP family transporter n=1 Tax=Cyanobium TaxID=167375 RepID=UPI001F4EF226|nr:MULTISPECIES: TSUP family transporter [Cyanobium]